MKQKNLIIKCSYYAEIWINTENSDCIRLSKKKITKEKSKEILEDNIVFEIRKNIKQSKRKIGWRF